jgi:hypothetical protein
MVTVAKPTAFEPVFCETCAGLGRSITLYRRGIRGRLHFLGKLMDTLTYDPLLQGMVLPCRVCKSPTVIPLH